ncbi:MAG: D-aminoacyl-tRNA deacylase [Casimicrobiaceae bacterium]|nr:D-aminoacyl-tRNA deacylase [Casimicrobiaceae bacterium]MCX8098405.1 D-aminoacyl-tRNA deacylase [Casimicrobiaceae bacterium]MDW8311117.1 D-aminoacyl-tRNA deacylase [Burkholderiales bacterium]
MRLLVQRVRQAHVEVAGETVGAIGPGLLALVGLTHSDDEPTLARMAAKLVKLRIFEDEVGKMNRSVLDLRGEVLVVSQFTLYADARGGNRPSFTEAARPERAQALFERFVALLEEQLGHRVPTGRFGADMQVHLINDGPVTIWLDSATLS